MGTVTRPSAARRSKRQLVADVAISLAIGLFLMSLVEAVPGLGALPTTLGVLAGAVQGLALWWRRSHPVVVTVVVLAGATVTQLVAPYGVFSFAGLIAVGSLAAARGPLVSVPALAALLGITALNFRTTTVADTQFVMAVDVVAWALGEAARNRRKAIEEGARRAVSDEHARIARDLHDVIAHSVSVIVVQAAAADDVFDERPDQAREALRSIEGSARSALADLRRVLAKPGYGSEQESSETRELGLAGLDGLVAPVRASGLEVEVHRDGLVDELSPEVDHAAYRIVQEALTNTLRHAGASHAEVTVRALDGAVVVEVVDDGEASGQTDVVHPGGGRGIIGMRERVRTLGGSLDAGPREGGGFAVRATIPRGMR
jgi:signal transduction histidine kinase